ncbi:MAG: FAD-binding protein, partial [Calditrichaeota bacterium]|nr:FAD-binding protein [Calditrichota bacterium]
MNWRERLARELSGAVLFEEPLARHTTYKIGGPAEVYARPSTLEDVRKLLRIATEASVPVFVIGEGSNLLVSDAGVRGVVLDLRDAAGQLVIRDEEVEVGAGLPLQQVVETTARAGLAGLENLAGIPGTVGGAVVMNAGAFGTEFFDLVSDIDVMTSAGEVHTIRREQLDVGYRRGYVPADGVILAARLRLRQ